MMPVEGESRHRNYRCKGLWAHKFKEKPEASLARAQEAEVYEVVGLGLSLQVLWKESGFSSDS
jgi:hypothetical protein